MVPVVDSNNKPLMPCTERRARRMVEVRKATSFWSFGIWCVRLNVEPSARNLQDVACGIDPGSKREGFTVKSKEKTFINVQSHAVSWVKSKVDVRRNLRRSRRFRRTPCRQPRWANRLNRNHSLPPSTKARWQLKLRILNRLLRLYPIKIVVIEDCSAPVNRGRRWNKSFSMLQVGKSWLYNQVRALGLVLMLANGYETSERRKSLGLKKSSDKLSDSFSAHCVDSFVLAVMAVGGVNPSNERVHLIEPIQKHYRNLHVQLPAKGGVRKAYGSTRSMGFERGSIVRHRKHGVCLVGGTSASRVSLHTLSGKRVSQFGRCEDITFLAYNSFNFR